MVDRYIRAADRWRDNAAAGLLSGGHGEGEVVVDWNAFLDALEWAWAGGESLLGDQRMSCSRP